MSTTAPIQPVAQTSSAKMLQAMVGIGIMCALLIVLTFEGTLPRIERNKAEALEKAIFKVVPGITSKQTFALSSDNQFSLVPDDSDANQLVYAGYDADDKLVGLAIEASGMGFADVIRILYGYDVEREKIIGFYVLESKETPGLGDKIEKDPSFLANFEALDVSLTDDKRTVENKIVPVKHGNKENPWEVDGITGATISSRAIGNILGESTGSWAPKLAMNQKVFATKQPQKSERDGSE